MDGIEAKTEHSRFHLEGLARIQQEGLHKGADLLHQAGRLASLPQTLVRKHPNFKKRALLLAAGVGIVGIVGAVVVRDYIVGREVSNNVQISQSTSTSEQQIEQSTVISDNADEESVTRILKELRGIDKYMRDYLANDIGDGITDSAWGISTISNLDNPYTIKMKVSDPDGIGNVCDFPAICNDVDISRRVSRRVPTGGPGTGDTYKTLPYDVENYIEGEFTIFIWEFYFPAGTLKNVWALRSSDVGGWPAIHGQSHPELIRICGNEGGVLKCYVSLEKQFYSKEETLKKKVEPISIEQLAQEIEPVSKIYPHTTLPRPVIASNSPGPYKRWVGLPVT